MNIQQRGPQTWLLTWYDGRKRRYETFHGPKKDAEVRWHQMKARIDAGTAPVASDHTVESWMVYWLKEVQGPNIRPGTYHSYRALIRYFIVPQLGAVPLQKLTPAHVHAAVQAWHRQRVQTPKSDGTPARVVSRRRVRQALGCLRAGLDRAVLWHYLPTNPAQLVDMPPAQKTEARWWTAEEALHFMEASRAARYWIVWTLALWTGMRQGEILGLRWQDIDWEYHALRVRQQLEHDRQAFAPVKTDRGNRAIPIDPLTEEILRQHRVRQLEERVAHRGPYHDWDLVVATKTGTPVRHRNLLRAYQAEITKAELPYVPFHALRHTHGSLLAALGVDARVIADRLGHSRASFTQDTYIHANLDQQRAAIEKLSRLWRTQP